MELILARHGETEYNRQRKFYGSRDVSLNQTGQQQACQLATRLLKKEAQPTQIVVTDLVRTWETVRPYQSRRSLCSLTVLPELAEKGFGAWEGLDANEIEAQYPDEWAAWLQAPLSYTPPRAEPFAEFAARVRQGEHNLLRQVAADDRVLIVAHLGSLRVIYQDLVDATRDFYTIDFQAGHYSVVHLDDHQVVKRVEMNL